MSIRFRLQLFERIIDADKIHTHIITSEHPRSIEEARDVVGRVVYFYIC